jgi:hypothetical protein
MSTHTDWWEGVMERAGRCAACEQQDLFNSPDADLSASQPSVYKHNLLAKTCKESEPRNRRTAVRFSDLFRSVDKVVPATPKPVNNTPLSAEQLFTRYTGTVVDPIAYNFDDEQRELIFAFTDWCIAMRTSAGYEAHK